MAEQHARSEPPTRAHAWPSAPGAVRPTLGAPLLSADIASLQRAFGNQAVQRYLARGLISRGTGTRASPVPVPVQRAFRALNVTTKTSLRKDKNGAPDLDDKLTGSIWPGAALEMDDPPQRSADDEWTRVRQRGKEWGWIRTAKVAELDSLAARVVEARFLLETAGHTSGRGAGGRIRAFANQIVALEDDAYTDAWDTNNSSGSTTEGMGFYNPTTEQTYIKKSALDKGTVLHEMLHALSSKALGRAAGRRADEGATEWLRMQVQGSSSPGVHANYDDDHRAIAAVASKGGTGAQEAIRSAYFTGELGPFRRAVETAVDVTTMEYYRGRLRTETRAAWTKVRDLLPSGLDRAGPWEMWCAFGRGDFGDVLGYLINGRPQPVVVATTTTTATPTPSPSTTPATTASPTPAPSTTTTTTATPTPAPSTTQTTPATPPVTTSTTTSP